jgi:hypothetical protein
MAINDLLVLARSNLWSDRVRAGQELSAHAGQTAVDVVLRGLLLDAADTAVIAETADALFARGDLAAWRVVAGAWGKATPEQADHLSGSLSRALFAASLDDGKAEGIRTALAALMVDKDQAIRRTAGMLMSRVTSSLGQ